jgi:hypothetical protein
LSDALLVTVASYRDYSHYRNVMLGVYDDFDETLEYCDTESWLNLERSPHKVDALISQCEFSLATVTDQFSALADRAKATLIKVLKVALKTRPSTQKKILGQAYSFAPGELNNKIIDLFDALDEVEYCSPMPENMAIFKATMKAVWGVGKE